PSYVLLWNLRSTSHVVLRGIDVAPGVQTHVHPAHDLALPSRSVVLLEDLHLELNVLLETRRRAHRKILGIELQAYVDDSFDGERHALPLLRNARLILADLARQCHRRSRRASISKPAMRGRRHNRRCRASKFQ